MAELRELAGGWADLLAEVTGVLEGTSEGELDEPIARQAARLCRQQALMSPRSGVDRGRQAAGGRCQDAAVLGRAAITAKLRAGNPRGTPEDKLRKSVTSWLPVP